MQINRICRVVVGGIIVSAATAEREPLITHIHYVSPCMYDKRTKLTQASRIDGAPVRVRVVYTLSGCYSDLALGSPLRTETNSTTAWASRRTLSQTRLLRQAQ